MDAGSQVLLKAPRGIKRMTERSVATLKILAKADYRGRALVFLGRIRGGGVELKDG